MIGWPLCDGAFRPGRPDGATLTAPRHLPTLRGCASTGSPEQQAHDALNEAWVTRMEAPE